MTRQSLMGAAARQVPPVMLPYQGELIRAINAHRFVVEEKSRRIGMTWAVASEAVLTSGKRKADKGMDTLYIGYNLDMAKEFIDTCATFVRAFFAIEAIVAEFDYVDRKRGEPDKLIKALRIDFPSGFSIVALTSNPRSLRGRQGFLIFDEAAFHDDLPGMIKAGMAFLMRGGKVLIISTHDGEDNAFNELVQAVREGRRKGVVLRHTFDDAVDQGLYESIARIEGWALTAEARQAWVDDIRGFYAEDAAEELDCIPSRGSGIYFTRSQIEAAMHPENRVVALTCPDGFEQQPEHLRKGFIREWFEANVEPVLVALPRDRRTFFGQDFARSSDLSVIAFGQETGNLALDVPIMVELRNVPFRDQEWLLRWCVKALPVFIAGSMDARGNGQALAEAMQQDFGFDRIEAVMASQKTYLESMPLLKARIEDRSIILPRSIDVRDDLRTVKLVRGVPMVPERTGTLKERRHGDAAIALMNLVRASRSDAAPIAFAAVGNRVLADPPVIVPDRGFGVVAGRQSFEGW